jgi:RNA polymerase sigma factor (sigma-70 family)
VGDGSNDAAWIQTTLERLEGPLVRFALPIAGDLESARDAVQDAFLRLLEQPRARVEGHVASWLFTVVRRRALDVRKKEGRMRSTDEVALDARPGGGPGAAAVAETNDLHQALLLLVDRLPAPQQEVVRLRFQGGLSYREISDVTGHSESNVGFLLHVAIKALRAGAQVTAVSGRTA